MATFYGGPDDPSLFQQQPLQMGGGSSGGYDVPSPAAGGGGQRFYGLPGYDANGFLIQGSGSTAGNNAVSSGTGTAPEAANVTPAASNPRGGGFSTTNSGLQYGTSVVAGQPFGQAPGATGGLDVNNLLKSLMTQAQTDYTARMKQYHNLLGSITGKGGLLSQLGQTGENRIAQNEANQVGKTEQDLTSRGLGNSTIRSSMLGGVHKNAEQERQSLQEGIAGQKIGASEQLFGMNPAPGMDTYLNMLTRLGGTKG